MTTGDPGQAPSPTGSGREARQRPEETAERLLTWWQRALRWIAWLTFLGLAVWNSQSVYFGPAEWMALIASGHDIQVVHSEIDFMGPVRWRDSVRVEVHCQRIGSTSFTLGFSVLRSAADTEEKTAVRGHNVYVVVSTDDWAKRQIPAAVREALTSVERQAPNVGE